MEGIERLMTDTSYRSVHCTSELAPDHPRLNVHKRIRTRHDLVNAKLNRFNVLNVSFSHNPDLHVHCFHAVTQTSAVLIATSKPLF